MTEPTAPQRALLDYLLAYHRLGLTAAARAALPLAAACDLEALRERGLVELRYVPIPQPQRDEAAPIREAITQAIKDGEIGIRDPKVRVRVETRPTASAPAASPRPKRRHERKRPVWTPEAKQLFLAALARGGIPDALEAAGFSPQSRTAAYHEKRSDPEFARRWNEVLAARKTGPAPAPPAESKPPAQDPPPPSPPPPAPPAQAAAKADPARPQRRRKTDADIARETLDHEAERQRIEQKIEAGRRDLTAEEAQRELQRRGWAVYRASVVGGRADRWAINGVGKDLTDAELIERAERALEREKA